MARDETSRTPAPEAAAAASPSRHYLRFFKSNVYVRDYDRSLAFFVDRLGFSVVADGRYEFGRWVAITPPDGGTLLALIAPKRGTENYRLIGRNTNVSFIAEDINATWELWRSRGIRFVHPPQPQLWGGSFATFEDIDGNVFELLGSDEISREIEAQRRLANEKLEAEHRIARELEIARDVQARLFPQCSPPLRTLDYAGVCIQARHVGGDYYDFLSFGPNRAGLVVGDISGKGIAAALLMANLQANLRSQLVIAREEPQLYLTTVNRLFFDSTVDSAYSTIFFAEYEDDRQRMRYANGGHLPGLLLRAQGQIEELHSTGTVLGMFRNWNGHTGACQLSSGDTLALYTDGVTEASNALGEEFGPQRLAEALRRHPRLSAKETVAAILEEVQQFAAGEQADDITLIIARCRAAPKTTRKAAARSQSRTVAPKKKPAPKKRKS